MSLESACHVSPSAPVLMAEDRIVVMCGRSQLWRSLLTVSPLPRWARVVRGQSAARQVPARAGTRREWHLALGRRGARVVERCIEANAETRLAYLIESDAGRLSRCLAGLVFAFELEAAEQGKTVLWLRTYYPSTGPLGRLLRAAPMRRQFAALRMMMLRNLKRVAERAAARALPAQMPWDAGAVVPPVALLMRER